MPRPAATSPLTPLVQVRDLAVDYHTHDSHVHALRGASLDVGRGRAVGLLGESGSGKSTLARALIGLLPPEGSRIVRGSITVDGIDVTGYDDAAWRRLRGSRVAMVFQDPLTFLNPVMRIDRQVGEALEGHGSSHSARTRVRELLELVQLPARTGRSYPHELSGGMRQRVLIAIALSRRPELLIADEPTTALDVTTQAAVLELLADIQQELDMALLLVSHDLAVLSQACSRVYVMYAGQTIEHGDSLTVFSRPAHPYTIGLLQAAEVSRGPDGRFSTIDGHPPDLSRPVTGCPFAHRCPSRHDACAQMPAWYDDTGRQAHLTRCWLLHESPDSEPAVS